MGRRRVTHIALGLVSAAALLAPASASARDDFGCGVPERQPWSAQPVQLCPLTWPEANGNVPVYRTPVARAKGTWVAPAGWLHGTANQRFACQKRFPNAMYYHAKGWRNNWWAYTLSDDKIWGWVPQVYFRGGLDDEADGGLRPCEPEAAPPPPPPAGNPQPVAPKPPARPAPRRTPPASVKGGTIYRQEVLARSESWIKRHREIRYSQSRYSSDGYRQDCSGYVLLAWHAAPDTNSDGLITSRYTWRIRNNSQLLPGDMLWMKGHVALFIEWAGRNKPRVREMYMEGRPATERTWSPGYFARYKAYRYNKIR